MIYQLYELQRAAWTPMHLAAELGRTLSESLAHPPLGRAFGAACELVARGTRSHRHAAFMVDPLMADGGAVELEERVVEERAFCTLRHFARARPGTLPRVLVVAPLSGHFAALLSDAVRGLLAAHDVYVTDWKDAREVPLAAGPFDLDAYIDYLLAFIRRLGPELHLVAFSQATVPALAASALLAAAGERAAPRSLTLVAGPVDARVNAGPAQLFAASHAPAWYEATAIGTVPRPYPGAGRRVLPGFLQLAGYLSHDLGRHIDAHWSFFGHLLRGEEAEAAAHRRFYDRFFSVLDLTAEFFLETLVEVFQKHSLARGAMRWRGAAVEPRALERTALLTVEGGRDGVSPPGQTAAAHGLCSGIPASRRAHHLEAEAGHLGLFYGHHWQQAIEPRIRRFIRSGS